MFWEGPGVVCAVFERMLRFYIVYYKCIHYTYMFLTIQLGILRRRKIDWIVRSTLTVEITSLIHNLNENPVWSKILKGSASTVLWIGTPPSLELFTVFG